jgi:hypothetical protein
VEWIFMPTTEGLSPKFAAELLESANILITASWFVTTSMTSLPPISSLFGRKKHKEIYCMTQGGLMSDPLAAAKVKAEKAYNVAAESSTQSHWPPGRGMVSGPSNDCW